MECIAGDGGGYCRGNGTDLGMDGKVWTVANGQNSLSSVLFTVRVIGNHVIADHGGSRKESTCMGRL